jgi:hypothetical protein
MEHDLGKSIPRSLCTFDSRTKIKPHAFCHFLQPKTVKKQYHFHYAVRKIALPHYLFVGKIVFLFMLWMCLFNLFSDLFHLSVDAHKTSSREWAYVPLFAGDEKKLPSRASAVD